jgi:hypothetical protein
MSVYVDNGAFPFGRMIMCHMIADSHDELIRMVNRLGIDQRHIQDEGSAREHFDICQSMRLKAIRLGAISITKRELVSRMNQG